MECRLEKLYVVCLGVSMCLVRASVSLAHVAYALAILIGLWLVYQQRQTLYLPKYWKTYASLLGVFLLCSVPTLLFVGKLGWSIRTLLYMYLYPALAFFLTPLCIRQGKFVYRLLAVFLITTVVDVGVSAYQVGCLGALQGQGFRGPILSLAGMLVMGVPVSAYLATSEHSPVWLKRIAGISFLVYIGGLFSNRSRALWLLFPLGTLAAYGRKIAVKLILIGMALSVIGFAYYQVPIMRDRLSSSFNVTTNQSNLGRIYVWTSAIHMIQDHPVLGVGLNQFKDALEAGYRLPQEKQKLEQAHNNFLQVFAEEGIVGGIGFSIFLLGTILYSWKAALKSNHRYIGMIGVLFLLYLGLFGLIEHTIIRMPGYRTMWVLSGLFYTLFVLSQNASKRSEIG